MDRIADYFNREVTRIGCSYRQANKGGVCGLEITTEVVSQSK